MQPAVGGVAEAKGEGGRRWEVIQEIKPVQWVEGFRGWWVGWRWVVAEA